MLVKKKKIVKKMTPAQAKAALAAMKSAPKKMPVKVTAMKSAKFIPPGFGAKETY